LGGGGRNSPPERPKINTARSGDGSPPVGPRGTAPTGGLGDEVPQKLKLFAHNILKNGYRKCVFRHIDIVRK